MNIPPISLQGFAITSLLVAILIAVFLPLRPLLRRMIGSGWVCILWIAILARLLVPMPLEFRWGLLHRAPKASEPRPAMPEPQTPAVSMNPPENTTQVQESVENSAPAIQTSTQAHPGAAISRGELLYIAWMTGCGISFLVLAWRWVHTSRLAARAQPLRDERLSNIFASIPEQWRGKAELRIMEGLDVPTLAGIFRPQIWLPAEWAPQFSDVELRNILLHEIGHLQRGDLAVQWLFAVARCVHWFNPMVWVAAHTARFDREMACDAWVLARTGANRDEYGAALLKTIGLLRRSLRVSPMAASMASTVGSVRTRVSGIAAYRPVPSWRGAMGILLMAVAITAATTRQIAAEDKPVAPVASPAADPITELNDNQPLVSASEWIFQIPEESWVKLCHDSDIFKKLAPEFPELNHEKPSFDEIKDSVVKITHGNGVDPDETEWNRISDMRNLSSLYSPEEVQKLVWTMHQIWMIHQPETNHVDYIYGLPSVAGLNSAFNMGGDSRDLFQYDSGVPGAKPVTHVTGLDLFSHPKADKNGVIRIEANAQVETFLGFLEENNGAKKMVFEKNKADSLPVFSTSGMAATTPIAPGQTHSLVLGCVRLESTRHFGDERSSERLYEREMGHDHAGSATPNGPPATQRYVVLFVVTATMLPGEAGGGKAAQNQSPANGREEILKKIQPALGKLTQKPGTEGVYAFNDGSLTSISAPPVDDGGLIRLQSMANDRERSFDDSYHSVELPRDPCFILYDKRVAEHAPGAGTIYGLDWRELDAKSPRHIPLSTEPVPGHPDMLLLTPTEALKPGLFSIHTDDSPSGEFRFGVETPDTDGFWLEVVRDHPDGWQGHDRLGANLYARYDFADTLAQWKRCVELNPESYETRSNYALVLLALGRTDEALVEYKQAFAKGANWHMLQQKTENLIKTYHLEQAVALAGAIRTLEPDDADAQMAAGNDYTSQEQWGDAVKCFQRTLEIKPGNEAAKKALEQAQQKAKEVSQSN